MSAPLADVFVRDCDLEVIEDIPRNLVTRYLCLIVLDTRTGERLTHRLSELEVESFAGGLYLLLEGSYVLLELQLFQRAIVHKA